jgi:hypothetical protein
MAAPLIENITERSYGWKQGMKSPQLVTENAMQNKLFKDKQVFCNKLFYSCESLYFCINIIIIILYF